MRPLPPLLWPLLAALALPACDFRDPATLRPKLPDGLALQKTTAAFDEALALASLGRCQEAAEKFLPLVDDFRLIGHLDRAAESAFWLGFCHEKLGRIPEARQSYQLVLRDYKNSPAARRAAERLAALPPPPQH